MLYRLISRPPPFSAMSDVVNDSFIPKLYPQQQDSECRMVDRLLADTKAIFAGASKASEAAAFLAALKSGAVPPQSAPVAETLQL